VDIGASGSPAARLAADALTADRNLQAPDADGELQALPSGAQRLPYSGDGAGLAPLFVLKVSIPGEPGPIPVPFFHDVVGCFGAVTNDSPGQSLDLTGSSGFFGSVDASAPGVRWSNTGNSGGYPAGSTYTGSPSGGGVAGDAYLLIAPRASS